MFRTSECFQIESLLGAQGGESKHISLSLKRRSVPYSFWYYFTTTSGISLFLVIILNDPSIPCHRFLRWELKILHYWSDWRTLAKSITRLLWTIGFWKLMSRHWGQRYKSTSFSTTNAVQCYCFCIFPLVIRYNRSKTFSANAYLVAQFGLYCAKHS